MYTRDENGTDNIRFIFDPYLKIRCEYPIFEYSHGYRYIYGFKFELSII